MLTEEAIKRFRDPKNVGELKDFNGFGKAGDASCSDVISLQVKFSGEIVRNAKFKVFGCPGAVSTTDVFIDMIKGKDISESLKMTEEDISNALGGLPTGYMHCSKLPMEAFRKAVRDYKGGKNENSNTNRQQKRD